MFKTRVLASSLVFLALNCPSLKAAEPGLSVSWKTLSLGDFSLSEVKPDQALKEGPVDFDLKGAHLDTQVAGFEIGNGKLTFRTGKFELRYEKIIGKNILIADLPKITGLKVKIEKTRTETVLFRLKDVALIAEKKEGADFGLNLPSEIPLQLSQNTLRFVDAKDLVTSLQNSIDESLSDGRLDEGVTFRFENVPGAVESLARGQKPALYKALREALKQEVSKPTFIEKLETQLTQKLPHLEAPQSLSARVTFRPDSHGYASVSLGSAVIETTNNDADLVSVANTEGMNLLIRSLFSGIAQGKIHAPWPGRLSYSPSAKQAVQLADIVAQMSGVAIEGANVETLAIDLVAPVVTLSEEDIGLKVNLILTLKSGEPVHFPAHFKFSIDADGALVLNRIYAESTGKTLKGAGFPLFRTLQTEVKLKVATLLLNQQLAQLQKGQVGTTKTKFELLPGADPMLRISANR